MSDTALENGEEEVLNATEEEQEEPTLIKKEIGANEDGQEDEPMHEVPVVAASEEPDRTEDQVPDISPGMENGVEEPLTASADEIEELPVAGEEENTLDEESLRETAADIPVAVMEEAEKEEPTENIEEQENGGTEVPVETMQEEAAGEPIEVETMQEEVTTEVEEEPAVDEGENQPFELQQPPTPKHPRTPNELDNVMEQTEEEPAAVEAVPPQTPKTPTKRGSIGVSTPTMKTVPLQDDTESADVVAPLTPKSPGVRRGSALSTGRGETTTFVPNGTLPNDEAALQNHVGSGSVPATPRSGAVAPSPRTPKSGGLRTATESGSAEEPEFKFEEKQPTPAATPRSPKKTTFEDEAHLSSKSSSPGKSSRRSKSPRAKSPKKKRVPKSAAAAEPETGAGEKADEEESEESSRQEPVADDTAEQVMQEIHVTAEGDTEDKLEEGGEESRPSRRAAESPSPPPRERKAAREYAPAYEQEWQRERETVPARLPTSTSFSSFVAPERESYKSVSPWVATGGKYRNEHTTGVPALAAPAYVSFFDDMVSSGPFSASLYSSSRALERSRSRTRERKQALRSHRSASNYYRFASQYPAPLRTRDYSTPPSTMVSRLPSQAASHAAFLGYSSSKNYELARDYSRSRSSLYDSNQALARWGSRGNIDYYLGSGRLSRIDSYVANLNTPYEWGMPASYETYRAASRYNVGYTPLGEYSSYPNPYYDYSNADEIRRIRRYTSTTRSVRGNYESRIDNLQRSLSRERYEKDRLRTKYSQVAHQLEQACKQMDLIRCHSYGPLRSGSQPRTSVYAHFYPYY